MRTLMVLLAMAMLVGCGKKEPVETPSAVDSATGTPTATTTELPPTGEGAVGTDADATTPEAAVEDGIGLVKYGVAAYPGAKPFDSTAAAPTDAQPSATTVSSLLFVTTDPPTTVMQFFAKELKETTTVAIGEGGSLTGKNARGDSLIVAIMKEEAGTRVSINMIPALK